MIELRCPVCNHILRIDDRFAGKQGQCKHCHGVVLVPDCAQEAGTQSTSLASLLEEPPGAVPARTAPVTVEADPGAVVAPVQFKRLGCLFWLLVLFLTPAALVWAIILPSGHPQKKMGIIVSSAVILLSLLLLAALILAPFLLLYVARDGAGTAGGAGTSALTMEPADLALKSPPQEYGTLTLRNAPADTSGYTWRSSDEQIAKVLGHDKSAMVYGMNPGTATVTAEGIMNGKTATATVTVTPYTPEELRKLGMVPFEPDAYAKAGIPAREGLQMTEVRSGEYRPFGAMANYSNEQFQTFCGHIDEDYSALANYFYQALPGAGWQITYSAYTDPPKAVCYIEATKGDRILNLSTTHLPREGGLPGATRVVAILGNSQPKIPEQIPDPPQP